MAFRTWNYYWRLLFSLVSCHKLSICPVFLHGLHIEQIISSIGISYLSTLEKNFTYFLCHYLWLAVSFLLSCRNETIDQISSTLFYVLLYLRLQPSIVSLFLAHLCHENKFKQVAHSVLPSVVKSYSPGLDLIKIERKNSYVIITLVVVLLMCCSEKLMLFKLKNTVSFPSSANHSQFRLAITSTHVYKKIPTALKC